MSLALQIVAIVAWVCDVDWAASYLRPCWVLLLAAVVVHLLEK